MLGIGLGLTDIRQSSLDSRVLGLAPTALYDPSDLSTMFQDTGKTTAVTSNNDPVRLIEDKSGNGNDLTANSDAARPLYKTDGTHHWLEFDGVAHAMNVSFTLNHPNERIAAVRSITWGNTDSLIDGGLDNRARVAMLTAEPNIALWNGGSIINATGEPATGTDFVLTLRMNSASSRIAIDNNSYTTGNVGSNPVAGASVGALGGGADKFSNIRWYGDFIRAGTMTDGQIATVRQWAAARAGVTL